MIPINLEERDANTAQSKIAADLHTPTLISPPETRTPPTATHQHHQSNGSRTQRGGRGSAAVDADILSSALKQFEDTGHQRDHTPGGSPSRKRQRVYGDR